MARKRLSAEQIVTKLRQIEVLQGHTCNNLSLRLVQNIGQIERPAGQLSHLLGCGLNCTST